MNTSSANTGFQRKFWIFQQEDSGFGSGQEPSGYIKIETRNGKAKLSALVQNLKEDENRLAYKLYIVKHDGNQVIPVCLGNLNPQRNKAEFLSELDGSNVMGTGNRMEDFNVAAVIVEYKDRINVGLICPLAAYKDKKISWRDDLSHSLYYKSTSAGDGEKLDLASIFHDKIQSKYEQEKILKSVSKPEETNNLGNFGTDSIGESMTGLIDKLDTVEPNAYGEEIRDVAKKEHDSDQQRHDPEPDNLADSIHIFTESEQGPESGDKASNHAAGADEKANGNEPDGCNIDKLKENLGRYFKEFDPFGSRRRDYRWWKVSSPVYLNNILYQCNARTPLLFNPKVMMAHFKYRHLIIGVYSDRLRRRECIVCGVPGAYSIDDNPFGEVCRWVQLEGNKPKYGAFGYWLIYIDPKTGKIINLG